MQFVTDLCQTKVFWPRIFYFNFVTRLQDRFDTPFQHGTAIKEQIIPYSNGIYQQNLQFFVRSREVCAFRFITVTK